MGLTTPRWRLWLAAPCRIERAGEIMARVTSEYATSEGESEGCDKSRGGAAGDDGEREMCGVRRLVRVEARAKNELCLIGKRQ